MVWLLPVPDIAPGLIVQVPAGKPFIIMLPVETEQVGCVIIPIIGVTGIAASITTFEDAGEVHPDSFVTVYE